MKSLLSTAALLVLLAAPWARGDEVYVRTATGSELKQTGVISSDDTDGIALRIAGGAGEQVFRLHEIIRSKVKYDCLQRHYEAGRALENSKEYDLAIGRYEEATKDAGVPKHARQYAWLHIAMCYEKMGDFEKAAGAYKKVLEEMPKTAFQREVAEGQFNCFVKLGKWDDAAKSLTVLENQSDEGKALAGAYRAELLELKGEYAKAVDAYKAVAKGGPGPDVLSKAHAGVARCLLLDGRAGEGAEYARKALAVKGCALTAAADAHEVIGESMLSGLPEKAVELAKDASREKALDAIEEMMRAVLQYKGSSWAEQRAYYFVGLWAGRLGDAGISPEWTKRSNWAFKELTTRYPKSPFVAKIGKK